MFVIITNITFHVSMHMKVNVLTYLYRILIPKFYVFKGATLCDYPINCISEIKTKFQNMSTYLEQKLKEIPNQKY